MLRAHHYLTAQLFNSFGFGITNICNHLCHIFCCVWVFYSLVPNGLKLFTDPLKKIKNSMPKKSPYWGPSNKLNIKMDQLNWGGNTKKLSLGSLTEGIVHDVCWSVVPQGFEQKSVLSLPALVWVPHSPSRSCQNKPLREGWRSLWTEYGTPPLAEIKQHSQIHNALHINML